jgi:hypothetical protein
MGMFDTIICKYPLPMPSDPKGYAGSESFQTKDLENSLSIYEIRADGTLWEQKHETVWIEGNSNAENWSDKLGHYESVKSWWDQVSFTSTISLLDYQYSVDTEYDYCIEYTVVFVKGLVSEITIFRFEALPNADRKSRELEFVETMNQHRDFVESKKYRYFYKHYNNTMHFVLRRLVNLFSWLATTISRLERWLTI